ncbi:InlB B-repeat-containing protein, partial [Clostridium sp. HCP1S3_B4]|uniref:InlB B-repeat-containing protein n=1 Tax=unclassified Clostridium TaxID=2614128 RepID=UPI003F8CE0B8
MSKKLNKIVSAAVLTTMVAGTGIVNPEIFGGKEVVAQAADETTSVQGIIDKQKIEVIKKETTEKTKYFENGETIKDLTFKCWRSDANIDYYAGAEIPNENATYTPVYTAKVRYMADGIQVGEKEIEYNENAQAPAVPTKAGYTGTWINDGKNIQKNTEITAKYIANKYTVTIESGEGKGDEIQSESKDFVYDSNLSESLKKITPKVVKGKHFDGWYLNGEKIENDAKFTGEAAIKGEVKLVAKYADTEITFDGYTGADAIVKLNDINKLPADPNKQDGREFLGWNTDKNATKGMSLDEIRQIEKNTTVYPIYKSTKTTIKFVGLDTKDINSQQFDINEKQSYEVKVPEAPAVEGKQFIGWKCVKSADEDTKGNIDYCPMDIKDGKISVPAGPAVTILKAVYGDPIKVIYNDGDNTSTITVGNGAKIALPKAKGQKDKLFKTWNCGTEEMTGEFDEGSSVIVKDTNNDKTVVIDAVYANKIAVTIQDKDGKTIKTVEAPEDGKLDLSDIKAPEVEGKEFTGWKVVSEETGNVTGNVLSGIKKGVIVKADYEERITLNVVDPVANKSKEIKVQKDQIIGSKVLVPEEKEGLTFKCWRITYTNIAGKEITEDYTSVNISTYKPDRNVTVTAIYNAEFKVTNVSGEDVLCKQDVEYNGDVEIDTPIQDKNLYDKYGKNLYFVKWQDNTLTKNKDGKWELKNIKKDTTVIALYAEPINITIGDTTVKRGKGSEITLENPKDRKDEGLSFKCWRDESGKEYKVGDVISNIQDNITIKPVYVYNFDITDTEGDKIASEEVEKGKTLTLPTVPTMKNGKEFRGWYVEGADQLTYDEKTKTYSISNITKDVKVIAYYGDTVTITAIDPVANTSKSYDVNINGTVTLTAKDRTKEGLTFKGWRNSSNKIVSENAEYTVTVKGNMPETLTAVYTANITFKYGDNGDTSKVVGVETEYGKDIKAPTVDDINAAYENSGKQFIKWDKEFSKATKDDTITAINGENVKINFKQADGKTALTVDNPWTEIVEDDSKNEKGDYVDKDGHSTKKVDGYTIGRGGSITLPTAPEIAGKTFVCYKDQKGNKYTGKTIDNIQENLTLTAVYGDTVQVIFKDGNANKGQTVGTGAVVKAIAPDTKEGTKFKCWRDANGNEYKEGDDINVTGALELKAIYTADVTFMADGKQVGDKVTVEVGSKVNAPEAPVKEGCDFVGWDLSLENITKDTVITANYKLKQFTVTIDGVAQTVEYGKDVKLPTPAEKEGYTFKGWEGQTTGIKADGTVNSKYEI